MATTIQGGKILLLIHYDLQDAWGRAGVLPYFGADCQAKQSDEAEQG